MVGDYDRNGQRDCGVQPVPAPRCKDYPAYRGHAGCRGRIPDGIRQDRRDGQVPYLHPDHRAITEAGEALSVYLNAG